MLLFYSRCAEAMECLVIRQESSLQHLVLAICCKLDAAAWQGSLCKTCSPGPYGASEMQSSVNFKLSQLHWLKLNDADSTTVAAMFLSCGLWSVCVCNKTVDEEAVSYPGKADWPDFELVGFTMSEAAYVVLGVSVPANILRLSKLQGLRRFVPCQGQAIIVSQT